LRWRVVPSARPKLLLAPSATTMNLDRTRSTGADVSASSGSIPIDAPLPVPVLVSTRGGELTVAVPLDAEVESECLGWRVVATICHAMENAVRLMRRAVGTGLGVKASGGVRSSEMAIRFLAAGANRLGTSVTTEMAAIIGPEAPTLTELFSKLPDPAPAPAGY
jgi:hypothetical protein